MAETNGSLQQNNPAFLQSLVHSLDPISLLLSQNSDPQNPPVSLKLITESFFMERGPRYEEYAKLRELKLRRKRQQEEVYEVCEPKRSPLKKQVRFQANLTGSRKGSSVSNVLAQSVPDFSATLRKENRKPVTSTPELTPPAKNWSRMNGNLSNSRGSKSANAGEKRGVMTRKSYASIEELKGLSMGVSREICGENRGRNGRAKTILGASASRQFSMFG
ncbi:uncharacterized protein LOC123197674 [Mangifera indica]|uniref:uncharacterized protein LOC123197674 n=1 Tax=Mangifera indica TaxID=29780 RepID=UPI001CFA301C|nr:uncharacterized protein LOC123197674 [Mangifera indica]